MFAVGVGEADCNGALSLTGRSDTKRASSPCLSPSHNSTTDSQQSIENERRQIVNNIKTGLTCDQLESESEKSEKAIRKAVETTTLCSRSHSRQRSFRNHATPNHTENMGPPQSPADITTGATPPKTYITSATSSPASYRLNTGSVTVRTHCDSTSDSYSILDVLLEDDDPNLFTIDENAINHYDNDCVMDNLARMLLQIHEHLAQQAPGTLRAKPLLHGTVVRERVARAAKIVADSLQTSMWPSPFRLYGIEADKDEDENDSSDKILNSEKHFTHMTHVGECIQSLAHDILLPAVLQELKFADIPEKTVVIPDEQLGLRVFLGTLVMLREILMQNKIDIFGPDRIVSSESKTGLPVDASSSMEVATRAIVSRQILATSIILAGLGEMEEDVDGMSGGELCESFLELMELYDSGDDEFADCLDELDELSDVIYHNGKRMRDDEVDTWRNACNLHRQEHPLFRMQLDRRRHIDGLPNRRAKSDHSTVPNSTASAIWHNPLPVPTAVYLTRYSAKTALRRDKRAKKKL